MSVPFPENKFNKMDLIEYLGVQKVLDPRYMQSAATMVLLRVTDSSIAFVKQWYDLCCNYHLVDDTPSISPNHPDFKDHRHDQSIFSLTLQKYPFKLEIPYYSFINRNSFVLDSRIRE
jgi:hypothetical protein